MTTTRVAVVFGGKSGEHEVSVTSARNVLAALDREIWEPVPIGVTADGNWLGCNATQALLDSGARRLEGGEPFFTATSALASLASCGMAFPLIHGTNGEDGTIQGLFEVAGMPYAGCGVAASAIGMDKALMKALFREAGVAVARYLVARSWEMRENSETLRRLIEKDLGYPCFVKPANGGSSVGVTKVRSREDLGAAFSAAFAYDDKVLVEEEIQGQEVECSVLGNERPEVSQTGEIVPDREFYDYESKYDTASTSALHIPARVSAEVEEEVRTLALRMYQVMDCEGYARVDFFVRNGTEVFANEINTIPGFTNISMYPKLWAAEGLEYSALLTRILDLGLQRSERRARL